ncbi:MAG: response regulator [FCB group bacterium]|nr:response regulator [FCB group bacterium]MBL7029421.1 response regulator [Candidatus Neomarinimicrobiota bacterium]
MVDSKSKILIVEDDLSSQQYYSIIFDEKYEIYIAPTVAGAKQILKEHEFKVAIVDISLPGGESGIDLIKYMFQEYPQKPVAIAVTAHAFTKSQVDAQKAGAVEFFSKPVMSGVLLATVDKYYKA